MKPKYIIATLTLVVSFLAFRGTAHPTAIAPYFVPRIEIGRIPHLASWYAIDHDLELRAVAEDVGDYLLLTAREEVTCASLADYLDDLYKNVAIVEDGTEYYYLPQEPPNPPLKVCVSQEGIEIVTPGSQDPIFVDMNWTPEY